MVAMGRDSIAFLIHGKKKCTCQKIFYIFLMENKKIQINEKCTQRI